ncbi:MAG: hypothetical protein ACUZ8H_14330, partial [Candidatus Anammoxibacter sp.]
WLYDEEKKTKVLFKIGRPNTGENWSEKASNELAKILGLPCADYQFARLEEDDKEGTLSANFVPVGGSLIHGNELLAVLLKGNDIKYPKQKLYKVKEYKINTVFDTIRLIVDLKLPIDYKSNEYVKKPLDVFVGYLMLDCWISNQDRHHENWGLVFESKSNSLHLAPTYDHASGLGCRISVEECKKRLRTRDKGYTVKSFVKKANSPFYDDKSTQLKSIDVFRWAAKKHEQAACYWLNKLESVNDDTVVSIFEQIPAELISQSSMDFAVEILKENKHRLVELKKDICNV